MKCLRFPVAVVILGLLLLYACAPLGMKDEAYEFYEESEALKSSRAEAAPEPDMQAAGSSADDGSFDTPSEQSDSGAEAGRLRIYNGSAGLIVENTEETRSDLEKLARDTGGYVESSYSDYLILRVPAEDFDEIFKTILSMGRIEFSRVETWDVTEAFADIERGLLTAEETRKRLYILLENSTDPAERARILREIGRLTEEIESLKQQLSVMNSRIAFSRITVQLTPRIQGDFSRQDIPFPWIAYLDPLIPAGEKLKGRILLDPGEEFAVFTKESVYMAENSSGVSIVVSTVGNTPRGDENFWQQALSFHLDPYYLSLDEVNITFGGDDLLGVELVSKDRDPFKYFVGVVADGRHLHVVEIFAPDSAVDFNLLYEAFAGGTLK